MENKDLYLNIKNELEYLLEKHNKVLDMTKYDSKEHLIALGQVIALADLQYSINYDSWLYKKEEVK